MPVIEVEVNNSLNANWSCPFVGHNAPLRGHLDFMRVRDSFARPLVDQFPNGIPGQRLQVNTDTGEASVIEPLQEPQHVKVRDALTAKNLGGFAPARQTYQGVDGPTALYWIKRAIDGGLVKLVKGSVPDPIPGKPRKRLYFAEPVADPKDKLIERLTALLIAKLPPAERKTVQEILDASE